LSPPNFLIFVPQVVSDVADTRIRSATWCRSSAQKLLHVRRWLTVTQFDY